MSTKNKRKVAQSIDELDKKDINASGMDKEQSKKCLRNLNKSISDRDFEDLTRIVIKNLKDLDSSKLRKESYDHGIDFEGQKGGKKFAGQAKQNQMSNIIPRSEISKFAGDAFVLDDFNEGYFVTTSDYTKYAEKKADNADRIKIINGDELVNMMFDNKIGINKNNQGYEIDRDFWNKFNKKEADKIDTRKIPQADKIYVLDKLLLAVSKNYYYKKEIKEYLKNNTDINVERQADYYALLAKELGFIYQDGTGEYNGQSTRKWYLTEIGKKYVEAMENSDHKTKQNILDSNIVKLEIIERILDDMNDRIKLVKIKEIINKNTYLSDSTSARRSYTVGSLLSTLSKIEKDGTVYKRV